MNLLEETLEVLKKYGKEIQDIDWIGSPNFGWFTWEDFAAAADEEYDDSYGAQEVASDLVIVFKDGTWLERAEYDGSEWWEYKQLPKKPEKQRKPKKEDIFSWGVLGWREED